MTTGRGETSIHWFRKGMRLHDNPAFKVSYETRTSRGDHYVLRPVYVLDPHFRKHVRAGANRWRFLQQSLADLDASLRKLGTRLYVVTGVPEEVFLDLFVKWNVKLLTFEVDTEPYARVRDERVERLAEQHGVKVERAVSHTIYNTAELVKRMKPPFTYGSMVTLLTNTVFHPREPISAPCSLPTQCLLGQYIDRDTYTVPDFNTVLTSGISNPDDLNTLPPCLIPGGETVALSRLNDLMDNEAWVCGFEKPKTSPNSLQPSTTVLSPYLKFGCLSASLFYHRLREVEAAYRSGAGHTAPPVSLVGQLYWREFYYAVGMATPNFDKMVGNPICVQVPWDDNPDALEAWTYGRTGYPFIDAIMRQLRAEGWVHHLARHAVACFLTRGDLWISWEKGLAVFEELLLDADWSMNAGNWMWVSASAFFHQFYRVYSPVVFGKKTDKNGDYIRKYVPELAGYPSKYIYEPWMAPRSVQLAAGCVVGEQYPKRVVVHEDVYKANIAKMSLAYKATKAARAIAKSSDDASGSSSSSSSLRNSSSSPNKKKCKKTHSPEQL